MFMLGPTITRSTGTSDDLDRAGLRASSGWVNNPGYDFYSSWWLSVGMESLSDGRGDQDQEWRVNRRQT